MNNNIRFELSFKNISQLDDKLNFCKLNKIKNINIPCKGLIKKDLFNSTIKYISENYNEFKDIIKKGGFVKCGWDGNQKTEQKIKEETKATIRCIPFDEKPEGLTCVYSGELAKHEVIYAKAY